jgi:hypothetical protein
MVEGFSGWVLDGRSTDMSLALAENTCGGARPPPDWA